MLYADRRNVMVWLSVQGVISAKILGRPHRTQCIHTTHYSDQNVESSLY